MRYSAGMATQVPTFTDTADAAPATKTSHPLVHTLTAIRKSQHLTQAELAQRAGLSRMTIQRLESNGLDPRLSTLQEMATVLQHTLVCLPAHLQPAFAAWLQAQTEDTERTHLR